MTFSLSDAMMVVLKFGGSLAVLLFAMNMLSSGIQKGTGDKLQPLLRLISGNRFTATLTGLFVTSIIQSSSATTVMVVSFVNAGVLTLRQSIGIIFGANIGTTVTAWIVSLLGFSFSITAFAIPLFGIGFYIYCMKKWKYHDSGEVLMGFGLLFLGLGLLTDILKLDPSSVTFISSVADWGAGGILAGVLLGTLLTALIHSSSAFTAIILALSYNGALPWEFAASLVLGSNIGTTIDALLASLGGNVNARRAALVHIMFNVTGTLIALILFRPLLALVDFIVPGTPESNITNHIAMLHTMFNVCCTVLFLPFVDQIASVACRIIKDSPDEKKILGKYEPPFISAYSTGSAAVSIVNVDKEIQTMTEFCSKMLGCCILSLRDESRTKARGKFGEVKEMEDYLDSMNEILSSFLVKVSHLDSAGRSERRKIDSQLQTISSLETFSDECTAIMHLLEKSDKKELKFTQKSVAKLGDYASAVEKFMEFITANMTSGFSGQQKEEAQAMENSINKTRRKLGKMVTHRIEDGADVNSELVYLELVRRFEKAADCIYDVVQARF